MKRLLLMAMTAIAIGVKADTEVVDGVMWTYTVSGGEVTVGSLSPWAAAIPSTTTGPITIPSSLGGYHVTRIEDYAFSGCNGLTSVTISEGVTSIGDSAFCECSGLISVTISPSVTNIGVNAFLNCSALTSVTMTAGVKTINANAFYGCSKLASVSIPSSVISIGRQAFHDTYFFEHHSAGLIIVDNCLLECKGTCSPSITIPDGVRLIASEAFYNCRGLTSVVIPQSVISIGDMAFYNCSGLTSVTIPNGVTSIGGMSFAGCSGLTSVTIPSSVTSIKTGAFCGCSGLKNADGLVIINDVLYDYFGTDSDITIPSNVTNISGSAFLSCYTLTSVTISEGVTSIDASAFSDCSGLTSVTIPASVTSIGDRAFSGCSGLTSVTIPASVTSIGNSAFSSCRKLISIDVNVENTAYSSINGALYDKDCHTLICCPGGIASMTIPSSVTSIGASAFDHCSVTSVTIPNSVTSVGDSAFVSCIGLTSVTIPNSVTNIGNYAFNFCSRLASVVIPDSVTSIGNDAFYYTHIAVVFVTDEPQRCVLEYFGDQVWYQKVGTPIAYIWKYSEDNGDMTVLGVHPAVGDIEIPSVIEGKAVTSIADRAFYECYGLTSVSIPNSVTSIGGQAFYRCIGLTLITMPNSVTSIEDWAFYGCSGLMSVTIPNSVTSIGSYAFSGCSGLTSVVVEAIDPQIADASMFKNCSALKAIYVPKESVEDYKKVNGWSDYSDKIVGFDRAGDGVCVAVDDGNCTIFGTGVATALPTGFDRNSVTNVTVGDGITEIGDRLFKKCRMLNTVTLGKGVTNVDENAFYLCRSLERIVIENPDFDVKGLENAIVYQTAIDPGGKLYTIPSITINGYEEVLYGTNDLKDDGGWMPVEPGKSMEESGYHFFKFVLKKIEE